MHLYSCRLCTRISRFPVQYSKLTLSHNSRNPAKMTKNPSLIRSRTCRLVRAENVFSGSFFHIVGTDNGIIVLLNPSIWRALWKHSSVKWFEQTTKIPLGLKFALCVRTNLIHFSLTGPLAGLRWREIPARWSDLLLQHWTTQVLPVMTATASKQRTVSKKSSLEDS